jgi:murein DD-endopeptidase MepM/ murein hydrolase activator NlpD
MTRSDLPRPQSVGSRMNIVVFSKRWARARHVELSHPLVLGAIVIVATLLFGAAFFAGARWNAPTPTTTKDSSRQSLSQEQTQIHAARQQLEEQLADLAARVGQVSAQMLRVNALGKRLTKMALLDKGEFNFDAPPAQGGAVSDMDQPVAAAGDLGGVLDRLEAQLIDRERQLVILETFISARQLSTMAVPAGNPVADAWISSEFGQRSDPFTGLLTFHSGIDLAASEGAQVHSVAPGVVTWAGERSGYGELVEINHGNGYITRYAHNSKVLVQVGDKVDKGQVVSQVGSTGHSTGPHLHFEVLRNGVAINPAKFIEG